MSNLRSMIDGTTIYAGAPVPIKPSPVATGGSSPASIVKPPVPAVAPPVTPKAAVPKPANGKPSAAAKHISDHVQDPVGATKDGFSKLQEAKLEYDKQRSDMALQLLPVQSVLDHVSQNHGIMNTDDPDAVDANGQPINPGAGGMSTGMQPGAVPGKGMPPARPGMPGTPGLAPSMGQTRPPQMGMPQPGKPAAGTPPTAKPAGAAPASKPAAGGAKKPAGKGVQVHVTAGALHNEVLSGATNNIESALAYGSLKAGKVLHSGKSRLNAMTPGTNGTTGMEFDASKVIRTCAKCGKMHASEDGCKGTMQAGGPGSGRHKESADYHDDKSKSAARWNDTFGKQEHQRAADLHRKALQTGDKTDSDKAHNYSKSLKDYGLAASNKGQGETFHMGDKPKDEDQFFEKMRDKMTIKVDQSSGKIKSPMAAGRVSDCEDECDDDEDCMDDCLDMQAGGPGSGRKPEPGMERLHQHLQQFGKGKPMSQTSPTSNMWKSGNKMTRIDPNEVESLVRTGHGTVSNGQFTVHKGMAASADCDCVKASGSTEAAMKGWGTRGRGKPHASASAKEMDGHGKFMKKMKNKGKKFKVNRHLSSV